MGAHIQDESVGELFAQLVDDAKGAVKAEVNVYRQTLIARVHAAFAPIAMLLLALLLVIAAVVTLAVLTAVALTPKLGPLGAGVAVAVICLMIAGLLAKLGANRLGRAAIGKVA